MLTANSPITYADLKVEGNGVAPRIVPGKKPEANPHTIKMTAGVTLTGRLVRDGKPVAGAAGGAGASQPKPQHVSGRYVDRDRQEGRFTFLNVHPDEDYFVYGMMGTIKDGGAVAVVRVHSGGDGTTTDAGDLRVVRGHRLKGQVLLSDGKPIPPKTRLMVSRQDAWDHQEVELDREGRFEISGLPNEKYSMSVSLRGYRISAKNHSIDPQVAGQLVGTIDQDIDSLKILMEPESALKRSGFRPGYTGAASRPRSAGGIDPFDQESLLPRGRAGNQRDPCRLDPQALGQHCLDRLVRFSALRRRCHRDSKRTGPLAQDRVSLGTWMGQHRQDCSGSHGRKRRSRL